MTMAFVLASSISCVSGRSTESFCKTMEQEKRRILETFDRDREAAESIEDPLLELIAITATSLQTFGELRSYSQKLAEAAPEEIRVDAELMAEGIDKQFESMKDAPGDPLGALFGSVVDGFTYAGPTERVNQFAIEECGQPI